MDRFYYQSSFAGLLADSEDAVLGSLARNNTFDLVDPQRNAWLYEISLLKDIRCVEPAGQRYISGNGTILLFFRENKNGNGISSNYCFLGPADYVSHYGSRPTNMEWRLRYKMPVRLCRITERRAIA